MMPLLLKKNKNSSVQKSDVLFPMFVLFVMFVFESRIVSIAD